MNEKLEFIRGEFLKMANDIEIITEHSDNWDERKYIRGKEVGRREALQYASDVLEKVLAQEAKPE